MTLRELKKLITNHKKGEKLPSRKKLESMNSNIILQLNIGTQELTVYQNGFAIYSNLVGTKTRYTVFSVEKLELRYEFSKNPNPPIRLSDYPAFDNYEAGEILMMCGQDRLDYNTYNREQNHTKQTLDSSGNYYAPQYCAPKKLSSTRRDFTDDVVEHLSPEIEKNYSQELKEAMSHLKEKQMEVIQLYFYHDMTQQQIADKLGISRSSVQDRLDGALKKLRKYVKK